MARCALELAFLQTFSAHEDIPGMQEPMVMGRGYESVGSSTKPGLAHRPSERERVAKTTGRKVNLSLGHQPQAPNTSITHKHHP